MALELVIWIIFAGLGLTGYLASMYLRLPHLFILACALIIGSGALLWGFDGLITSHYYAEVAGELVLAEVVVPMSNIGLQMLSLVLVATGILSALVINFNPKEFSHKNVFHY